jgi:hypothetical protein
MAGRLALAESLGALARRHDELRRLRPYWGPGLTKEQAIRAYEADHPSGQPAPSA